MGGTMQDVVLTEVQLAMKDTWPTDARVWSCHVLDPTLIRLATIDEPAHAPAPAPPRSDFLVRARREEGGGVSRWRVCCDSLDSVWR